MRWTWLALALLSCTRTQETKPIAADKGTPGPPVAYDAGSAPAALVMVDAAPKAPVAGPGMAAWTDPDVVAELTKSCRFEPPKPDDTYEASPLSCEAGMFGQSCAYDPCFNDNQDKCKPKCKRACDSCAAKCTDACESCKRPCKDEDCKKACATTCGACRQECVAANDRCISGTCGEEYDECRNRWRAHYKKSKCAAACPTFKECFNGCTSDHWDGPCVQKCRAKVRSVCPDDLLSLCENGD
jgi:hypothetical protein